MRLERGRYLGMIPARAGSKGITRKNIVAVAGRPLIHYTIEAAINSRLLDSVFVFTDDPEIQSYASAAGAPCIPRGSENASDSSSMAEAVAEFIAALPHAGGQRHIVLLQPTSPLRSSDDIDKSILEYDASNCSMALSVTITDNRAFKCLYETPAKSLKPISEAYGPNVNRQALPKLFRQTGAVYIFSESEFLSKGAFPYREVIPLELSEGSEIDVDDLDDVRRIEKWLEAHE